MAGVVKGFGVTFDYVLYNMSYANVIMYSASLPTYDTDKDKEKKQEEEQEVIKVDDPKNRQRVKQILDSFD